MNRRDAILSAMGLTMSTLLPGTLRATSESTARILVLVELEGGNDGLNTVIPYADDFYYRKRPNIALPRKEILAINDYLGLHSALDPLLESWSNEELAIILGVGYPFPNRSHFRSIDIWETGSSSDQYLDNGWLSQVGGSNSFVDGVVTGGDLGPLAGSGKINLSLQNLEQFIRNAKRLGQVSQQTENLALRHLLSVQGDVKRAAGHLQHKLDGINPGIVEGFGTDPFARQMQMVSQLILAGAQASVYKVNIGSFDTHANQVNIHKRLLSQLSNGLATFRRNMRKHHRWDDILVMTYSEFGRRVRENGSRGTDHGTAAPHFVLGGKIKGGIYGRQPSLVVDENSDLEFNLDYRRLYSTVVTNWWGLDLPQNLIGHRPINCV